MKKQRSMTVCYFCQQEKTPRFSDVDVLVKFTSDRGKIIARAKTGLCRRHQRQLTIAIKHARHLAMLPFVPGTK